MKVFSALVASLFVLSTAAFAPVAPTTRSSTALQSARQDEDMRRAASSVFAALFVASNVAGAALPAWAAANDNFDFGSTEVIAARSGGRSGGRAGSGGNSRSYRSSAPSTTYKSYSSTTYE